MVWVSKVLRSDEIAFDLCDANLSGGQVLVSGARPKKTFLFFSLKEKKGKTERIYYEYYDIVYI